MQLYACGFLMSPDRKRVLLIRKRRPAWQAGKLNGVGGKVEPGETPLAAMAREFREEAGLDITHWKPVVVLTGGSHNEPGWQGHFFRATGNLESANAQTDEQLEIHPVEQLPVDTIPNLHWMIPLAAEMEAGMAYQILVVSESREVDTTNA